MMYIITGVSRGVGRALALHFLEKGSTVIGVGRSHNIDHSSFSFVKCDLSNPQEVKALFQGQSFDQELTLINNAGILGSIKRLSDQENLDTAAVMQVNVVAPMNIAMQVYRAMKIPSNFTLVNISSGAANRAVPSWASYCASKSAINFLSEAFYLEEKEKGIELKVYAVSPGVVDTGMQKQIRETPMEDFSAVEVFRNRKLEGDIYAPEQTALRLDKLLSTTYTKEVFYHLDDVVL